MKVLLVDDDIMSLEYMKLLLTQVSGLSSIHSFMNPKEALEWSILNKPDVAFLDVEMAPLNGIELGKELQRQCSCRIIFVTAYENFALDAFKIHAAGYIVKPARVEDIKEEFKYVNISDSKNDKYLIKCQCFGNFEAFKDSVPLSFKHNKTRELLAYLVHKNGATCTVQELADAVLPDIDNPYHQQSRLRTLVADLMQTLKSIQAEDVVYKAHGIMAVIPQKIDCDYYDYLKNVPGYKEKFNGEYLDQYSWAQEFANKLSEKI